MSDKPIAIIIDTNCNGAIKNEVFSAFRFGRVDDFIEFIEVNDLTDEVELFLPEIVIQESIKHRAEELKTCLENISKQLMRVDGVFSDMNTDMPVKPEDRRNYIEQVEKRIRNSVNVIPIPENKVSLFAGLLDRAIYKKPPFKNKGESDQGFKDAVLWESVLEYFKNKKDYSEIIIFTKDKGGFLDHEKQIIDECKNLTGHTLSIRNDGDVIACISEKYKIHVDFIRHLKDVYYPELIEKMDGNIVAINGNTWVIESITIEGDSTMIERLFEYEAEVLVDCLSMVSTSDYRITKEKAKIIIKAVFSKNEDGQWSYKDEIVSSEII